MILSRYYQLERLPIIISLNPPCIRLHSILVCKVLLLLVTTFQNYYHFKPCLNIYNIINNNDLMSKNKSFYLYFNQKVLPHLDSLYTTRASKNLAFCPHIFSILYSLRTISGLTGTTCARNSVTPDL